jgi:hypothetical protein
MQSVIKKYKHAERHVWARMNRKIWAHGHTCKEYSGMLNCCLSHVLKAVHPASGLMELHKKRLAKILDKTFMQCNCELQRKYCGQRCGRFAIRELNREMASKKICINISQVFTDRKKSGS